LDPKSFITLATVAVISIATAVQGVVLMEMVSI
jgi:hypothetical protein